MKQGRRFFTFPKNVFYRLSTPLENTGVILCAILLLNKVIFFFSYFSRTGITQPPARYQVIVEFLDNLYNIDIFFSPVALPIFGVPLNQSVERSRCHDDTGLPLIIRDAIDYLQVPINHVQYKPSTSTWRNFQLDPKLVFLCQLSHLLKLIKHNLWF